MRPELSDRITGGYAVEMGTGRRVPSPFPWRSALAYGAALAAGTGFLDWIDYQRLARTAPGSVSLALLATLFLALGIAVGVRIVRRGPPPPRSDAEAQAALGITARELEVLHAIAEGLSTKEIARRLAISPNTVKTHSARLFEKLSAARRTEAIARARVLGLLF